LKGASNVRRAEALPRESYRRHLPHQIPTGFPIFLTWNLKGALPRHVLDELQRERRRLEHEPVRPSESPGERRRRHDKIAFAHADRCLGEGAAGPVHLEDPWAAAVVQEAILFGIPRRYELYAYVVMPNHVHTLLLPRWPLDRITKGIKGYTAYRINALQGARGRVFWQDESYDHWVRDEEEFGRIIAHIENNPVAAGFCRLPYEWPWSSAARRVNWPVGQAFQPDTPVGQAGKPDLRDVGQLEEEQL
jgi:putative transposase